MSFTNDVAISALRYNDSKLIFCTHEFLNVANNDHNKNWIIVSMADSCDPEFVDVVAQVKNATNEII